MNRKTLLLILGLAVIATPALAQKVYIDYAHDFDFETVKTFTYVDTPDSNTGNDLEDSRIQNAILDSLREGGLEQVDSGGDIAITYHVSSEENTQLNTTTYGYGGYGPGWGGYGRYGYGRYGGIGYGGGTTTTSTYTEGTLVIDAYDPDEENLVWRGIGTVTVKDDPAKRAKQIDKILAKLGKKWKKILKEEGK